MQLIKADDARTKTDAFRLWLKLHDLDEDLVFFIEEREHGKLHIWKYRRDAYGKIKARLNAKFEKIPETDEVTIDKKGPFPWEVVSNGHS